MSAVPTNDDGLRQEPEPPEDPYPFVATHEQGLRCFIYECVANAEIDGRILVENMEHVFKWITTGEVPTSQTQTKKRSAIG